ncbi:hypothetical protein G9A89_007941 [Geosiphon pyriformis]|nr:hypothetical protein G9A89_007941 [Geosiphon pyriformis]
MALAPIAKLEKFTSEEDDAQTWINDIAKAITANNWDDTRTIQKPQNFNAFKIEFLRYFSNNNSINHLTSTFTTLKQEDTETVTTYLRCFHRNLHQIQAIQADYFTAYAAASSNEDFEAAKLKANHTQAVNLVMNKLSDLDSKLKQFSDFINQKLERYLLRSSLSTNQLWQQETQICHNCGKQGYIRADCHAYILYSKLLLESKSISICLSANNANLSNTSISISNILTAATHNILTAATNSLLTTTINSNTVPKPIYDNIQKSQIQNNPKLEIGNGSSPTNFQFIKSTIRITPAEFRNQNYLSLLVTPEDVASSKQETNQKPLTHNIPPAASTENESLAAIFPFELEEITSVLLFSGAALDTKPITMMYTDAKVDGQYIKLILNSGSAGSIITRQLIDQLSYQVDRAASTRIITANRATKTLIGEIDDFSFEINGIIVPIKVLVMEATQYQTLVGNDWLIKTHAILD